MVSDKNLSIIKVNKTLENWASHAFPFIGKNCFEIHRNQEGFCGICPSQEILSKGVTYVKEIVKEYPDGIKKRMEVHVSPLKNKSDDIIGIIEYIRDITDQKKMESDLLRAKERAEDASKAKSEFLTNMSHEIRTPMNSILGFTEILLGKTENADQRRYLSNILTSGRSLLMLINDILDLSKIEAGKIKLNPGPLNIRKIIFEIKEMFSSAFKEKGIEFRTEIDDSIPEAILLDVARIRQILVNLVGNALKFTDQGYVQVSVFSENPVFRTHTASIFIIVRDSGIGIPEDQQKQIFEKFHQTDISLNKKTGGTGLGLPISVRLIEMMNGTISVDSEEGCGSNFRIVFNDVKIVKDPALTEAVSESDDANIRFDPATVLLVDDVFSNRALVKAFLEDDPFTVIEAETGQQALDLLGIRDKELKTGDDRKDAGVSLKPDVILLDLRMPGISGEKTAEIIRNHAQFRDVPIIAVTASVSKDKEERIICLFSSYLRKPFTRQQLISELCKFLPHAVYPPEVSEAENARIFSDEPVFSDSNQNPDLIQELIEELESKVIPVWIDAKEALIYDEISKLSVYIRELGTKYDYQPLTDWNAELHRHMQNYNIDALSKTFRKFYKIYESLKKKRNLMQPYETRTGSTLPDKTGQ